MKYSTIHEGYFIPLQCLSLFPPTTVVCRIRKEHNHTMAKQNQPKPQSLPCHRARDSNVNQAPDSLKTWGEKMKAT